MRKKIRRVMIVFLMFITVCLCISYHMADAPERGLPRPEHVSVTPFTQKDVRINGLRLRYIDEGAGETLILIPGLTSRIEEYDAMTEILRHRFRVIVLDFPGSGYSEKPVRNYDVAFYVDTLIAFLDELRITECAVAGGSLGGNVALRVGLREPERITTIIAWGAGSAWESKPTLRLLIEIFGGKAIFWPTVKIQSTYWYKDGFPAAHTKLREAFEYYDEVLSPGFISMYWGMAADQIGNSLFPLAHAITQPVLLLRGEQDKGLEMDIGMQKLADIIPHSALITLPETGHALAAERPAETAEAIRVFLDL
jgi:pimeloyl-ACP methyl ester carboxylesterase